MSWTEIRSREGFPYGGVPYDVILNKLEETDPDIVDGVRGYDRLHSIKDDYDDYARAEIIDWAPDAPYLESDQTRRDPGLSRSILNLHYNGTRGSNPELPRHPELFYGFTGNDPRGSENNPRFDQARGHLTSRAAELTVSMGNNDDYQLAERPWTAQSISYGMKEIHRRLKHNMKVFSVQKEGRPWGNNFVADEFAAGDTRAFAMGGAGESLAYASDHGGAPERFAAGDYGPAADMHGDGVRGADGARREGAETAPWRHATGSADLGVQQYGQERGAGRHQVGPSAQGGGRARASAADQDWAEARRAQSANRQVLGATMALAARYHRLAKSARQDTELGVGLEARGVPGSGLAPARDVAALYRLVSEDQARRPGTEVQDGEGGFLGSARGLAPASHPEGAVRASAASVAPNAYLTNAEAIVSGLREGTAAGRRRIAGQVVADGARHLSAAEAEGGSRRGALPGADYGQVTRMAETPLARSAASGLEVHVYRGAPPERPERRAAVARGAYDGATWRPQHEALPLGSSKAPGEWRSATQGQTALGDSSDRVFGHGAEVAGFHGAAPPGPKTLRAGGWSDSAALMDEVGEFSDNIGVGA